LNGIDALQKLQEVDQNASLIHKLVTVLNINFLISINGNWIHW